MKLRWLTLLILGTHFSIFAPNALAVEKATAESLPVVEATADDIVLFNDEWQSQPDDKWADISDEDVSLEKGNRRRRRHPHRVRHRDLRHPRVRRHRHRIRHPRRRIIRRGRLRHGDNVRRVIIINGGHGGLRYGEFRRDDVFFRNYPFSNDRFRRERFRRFRHDDFRHYNFDHDEFRLIIRSD